MSDTKDLFIDNDIETVVTNEVEANEAIQVDEVKPVKKKKERKPMDEDKKKILLERLAKGREQAKIRREQKAKGKELVEKKSKVKVEPKTSEAVTTKKAQVKIIDNSEDFTLLKNELAEIKKMLKNNRISAKKKEALIEKKKEVSMEIADTKKDLAPKEKPTEAVAKEITPIKVQGFSTIRNKRRKLRAGF